MWYLLDLGLADEELPGLAVVVGERLGPGADLGALDLLGVGLEAGLGGLARARPGPPRSWARS